MKIEILEFTEGAQQAKGVVVIIDVFRAFSVTCYAFDAGASRIIAARSIEDAFDLKRKYKDALLVGEREERMVKGFDLGNSPTEIIKNDISGKTIIHTTTAGTNGLVNAVNADMLITGSFVNAGAVVKFISLLNPALVTLVAMGYRARGTADEDMLCAQLISSKLKKSDETFNSRISDLRLGAGKRFFKPENIGFSPPTDFFLCTMLDRFDFVIRAEKRMDNNMDLIKTDL